MSVRRKTCGSCCRWSRLIVRMHSCMDALTMVPSERSMLMSSGVTNFFAFSASSNLITNHCQNTDAMKWFKSLFSQILKRKSFTTSSQVWLKTVSYWTLSNAKFVWTFWGNHRNASSVKNSFASCALKRTQGTNADNVLIASVQEPI